MGQIDLLLKDYLSDVRRYADVCNGSLFAGRLTGTQELLDILQENKDKNGEEACDMCKAITDLIEDGRLAGVEQGIEQGKLKMLINLASDGTITIQKAAEKAGMDVASFEKRMKE